MSRSVKIAIDNKGGIQTNFDGYKGTDCIAAAKSLENDLKNLGIEMDLTSMVRKDEVAEGSVEQEKVKA